MKRKHGAFINTRYSTDRQNEDSTETQIEVCRKWCLENRMPVLGIYSDEAVSGMKETRENFDRMMLALSAGEADTVIIYDQSRMFRKLTAWFQFREQMESMGVKVISATQPMIGKDLRDPANFLTEGSMALFNQMWVLQTRQRVIASMRHMAASGKHTGGKPPLGYDVQGGVLVINPQEAQIVRRIFREYVSGMSYRQIIGGLNRDGIRTKNGNQFGTNSLHDLLKNEKYVGVLIYGRAGRRADGSRNTHAEITDDCVRLENAVPQIIDSETWEAVQKKMAQNKRKSAGRPVTVREYPLKGKVFCAECGSAMVYSGSVRKNARYEYYACSGKQRLNTCESTPIRLDALEQMVADAVRAALSSTKRADHLLQVLREERDKLISSAAPRLAELIDRKNEITSQLANATNAILAGLNSPTLIAKIQQLEEESAQLDAQMRELKKNAESAAIPEHALQELLHTVLESADNAAVLSIVCRVEVSNTDICIWTILDTDPTDHWKDRATLPAENFIEIPGSGSPAPRIFINAGALLIKIRR